MYKKSKGPRGRFLYFKDGKMVSPKSIPEDVLAKLNDHVTVEPPKEKPQRTCIFCGEPGTEESFIDLQTIYLCQEHYLNKTKGEIAHKLRSQLGAIQT